MRVAQIAKNKIKIIKIIMKYISDITQKIIIGYKMRKTKK